MPPLPQSKSLTKLSTLFYTIVEKEKADMRVTSQGPQSPGTAPYPQLTPNIAELDDAALEELITKLQGTRQVVGRARASAGEPSDTGPRKARRPSASTPKGEKEADL